MADKVEIGSTMYAPKKPELVYEKEMVCSDFIGSSDPKVPEKYRTYSQLSEPGNWNPYEFISLPGNWHEDKKYLVRIYEVAD